jgi:hypothetical protein
VSDLPAPSAESISLAGLSIPTAFSVWIARSRSTRYRGVFAPAFAARAEIVPVGEIEYGWPDHLSQVRLIRTFRVREQQVNSGKEGCHNIDRA